MRRSQKFARMHTGRMRGKIFPDNQFIKGSTSGLVMNSYAPINVKPQGGGGAGCRRGI